MHGLPGEHLSAEQTDETLADPEALRDIAAAREEPAQHGVDLRAIVAARPDACTGMSWR